MGVVIRVQLHGKPVETGVLERGVVHVNGAEVESLAISQLHDLFVHGLVRTPHGHFVEVPGISQELA